MDKIFLDLSTPAWWVGVFFAGIIINLISTYLKFPLDYFFKFASSWWRNQSDLRMKNWQNHIQLLMSNKDALDNEIALELRLNIRAIQLMLFALFFMILSMTLANLTPSQSTYLLRVTDYFFACLCLFTAMIHILKSINCKTSVRIAKLNMK